MKKNVLTVILISVYIYLNSTFQLGNYISCGGVAIPSEIATVSRIVVILLQIIAPLILIIFGSFDFIKAIIAENQKEIKEKQQFFIKRLIIGTCLFLVVTFVQLVVQITADNTPKKNYLTCLKCMMKNGDECQSIINAPNDITIPGQGEPYEEKKTEKRRTK